MTPDPPAIVVSQQVAKALARLPEEDRAKIQADIDAIAAQFGLPSPVRIEVVDASLDGTPDWAYDEDDYCVCCGNGRWKHHMPDCELRNTLDDQKNRPPIHYGEPS